MRELIPLLISTVVMVVLLSGVLLMGLLLYEFLKGTPFKFVFFLYTILATGGVFWISHSVHEKLEEKLQQ